VRAAPVTGDARPGRGSEGDPPGAGHDPPIGTTLRGPASGAEGFVRPYRCTGTLNAVERLKLARHPYEAILAVLDRYARAGASAIAAVPGELERLKWAGIYPQRGSDDAFMLRVKVPGGRLEARQAREIGLVAETFARAPEDSPLFGNAYVDLTTRQDVQLHWVRIGDVPEIWERFDRVGLTTVQACGDGARNVLCCPLAGIDGNEVFDALPVAIAISDFFTGNRAYANLPRKFKISVTGCREDCTEAEINDIGLWPARREDGELGFNLLVGGGLSDGERMASDVDVFVPLRDAVEVCRAIAQVFSELGNRENRGLARMRYLVQELGPERFRAELVSRCAVALEPAGVCLTRRYRGDHVGVHPQRQAGLFAVGCCVPVGRMTGGHVIEAARLADSYGDGTLRLATDQNFILSGVASDRLDALLAEELLARFSPFPGPVTRGLVACTGSEYCRFAVVETKATALRLARWLDAELSATRGLAGVAPDEAEDPIRLHLSGCSASCAQPQIADIGLRGAAAHREGQLVEGADIGLGGSLGLDAGFVDWVIAGHPVEDLGPALARVIRRYRAERRPGEPLHAWARRVPVEGLRGAISGDGEPVEQPAGAGR
jgi:ferredoxin-nitrite reductase